MGFAPPPRKDTADFLVELPTELGQSYWKREKSSLAAPPRSSDDFATAFRNSLGQAARRNRPVDEAQEAWPASFGPTWDKPFAYYVSLNVRRRLLELNGNRTALFYRFLIAGIVGGLTGTLFYDLDYEDFATKYPVGRAEIVSLILRCTSRGDRESTPRPSAETVLVSSSVSSLGTASSFPSCATSRRAAWRRFPRSSTDATSSTSTETPTSFRPRRTSWRTASSTGR